MKNNRGFARAKRLSRYFMELEIRLLKMTASRRASEYKKTSSEILILFSIASEPSIYFRRSKASSITNLRSVLAILITDKPTMFNPAVSFMELLNG